VFFDCRDKEENCKIVKLPAKKILKKAASKEKNLQKYVCKKLHKRYIIRKEIFAK